MIVVSDASPLISPAVIGHLELLKQLYERVLIPDAVYQELTDSDAELPGAAEVRTLEWIVSQPVQNEMVVRALQGELDHGEAAAIALAVELQADVVLIDERCARAVASRLGLNVVGVLGVLVEAKHKALVPLLKPVLDDLITRAGFWVSTLGAHHTMSDNMLPGAMLSEKRPKIITYRVFGVCYTPCAKEAICQQKS